MKVELPKIQASAQGKYRLTYTPKTGRAIFDISNESGNIVRTGVIINGPDTIVDGGLPKGIYRITVVDGEALVSNNFEVLQD